MTGNNEINAVTKKSDRNNKDSDILCFYSQITLPP